MMTLQGKHAFSNTRLGLFNAIHLEAWSVMHTARAQCVDCGAYLKLEVNTSTSPYSSVACSSERPTEAKGGVLKTALAMASYSA